MVELEEKKKKGKKRRKELASKFEHVYTQQLYFAINKVNHIYQDIWERMFLEELLKLKKKRKLEKNKWPSKIMLTNKLQYIHSIEYVKAVRINKLELYIKQIIEKKKDIRLTTIWSHLYKAHKAGLNNMVGLV